MPPSFKPNLVRKTKPASPVKKVTQDAPANPPVQPPPVMVEAYNSEGQDDYNEDDGEGFQERRTGAEATFMPSDVLVERDADDQGSDDENPDRLRRRRPGAGLPKVLSATSTPKQGTPSPTYQEDEEEEEEEEEVDTLPKGWAVPISPAFTPTVGHQMEITNEIPVQTPTHPPSDISEGEDELEGNQEEEISEEETQETSNPIPSVVAENSESAPKIVPQIPAKETPAEDSQPEQAEEASEERADMEAGQEGSEDEDAPRRSRAPPVIGSRSATPVGQVDEEPAPAPAPPVAPVRPPRAAPKSFVPSLRGAKKHPPSHTDPPSRSVLQIEKPVVEPVQQEISETTDTSEGTPPANIPNEDEDTPPKKASRVSRQRKITKRAKYTEEEEEEEKEEETGDGSEDEWMPEKKQRKRVPPKAPAQRKKRTRKEVEGEGAEKEKEKPKRKRRSKKAKHEEDGGECMALVPVEAGTVVDPNAPASSEDQVAKKPRRPVVKQVEAIDFETATMRDYIYLNPTSKPTQRENLRRQYKEKKKELRELKKQQQQHEDEPMDPEDQHQMECHEKWIADYERKFPPRHRKKQDPPPKFEDEGTIAVRQEAQAPSLAPKLVMDENGNIVVDQASLTVEATVEPIALTGELHYETGSQVTYHSFSRRDKAERWSPEETETFYKSLGQFGIDFTLIQRTLPGKTRNQIKNKFKREERINKRRVDRALKIRVPVDPKTVPPMREIAKATPLPAVKQGADTQEEEGRGRANRQRTTSGEGVEGAGGGRGRR